MKTEIYKFRVFFHRKDAPWSSSIYTFARDRKHAQDRVEAKTGYQAEVYRVDMVDTHNYAELDYVREDLFHD